MTKNNTNTTGGASGDTGGDSDKAGAAYPPLPAQFEAEDDWIVYNDRLEQFFLAYDIKDDKRKAAVLLSSLSYDVFSTLSDLCFPDCPKDKTFQEVCDILKNNFAPEVSIFSERTKFYDAKQMSGESITEFVARLKSLTRYCKFGTYFNDVLRDRFVCGLSKGPVFDKVSELGEAETFQTCVKAALKKELALKESGKLNQSTEMFKINSQKYGKTKRQKFSSNEKYKSKDKASKASKGNCYACGDSKHKFSTCKYKAYKCKICKKIGHLAKVCRNKAENNYIEAECDDDFGMNGLYNLSDEEPETETGDKKCLTNVNIDGMEHEFEMDTGSRISACSEKFYRKHLHMYELCKQQNGLKLHAYNGSPIKFLGEVNIKVTVRAKVHSLTLLVIKDGGNPLLGRDFLRKVNPQYDEELLGSIDNQREPKPELNSTKGMESKVQQLVKKYEELFRDGIGCYKYSKVSFELKDGTVPVFHKARRVPLAFQGEYQRQIAEKLERGIIKKVDYSDWGTPLVSAPKPKGGLRICGDYKVTVNPHVKQVTYALPLIEDLFATLNGGEHFSKLDLSDAYNQLELDEKSQLLLTWSTTEGLFAPTRMPFGISPASSIFQSIICKTLQGCKGACTLLDDILVTGKDRESHINNLESVFKRLMDAGFSLRKEKCEFFKDKVAYLGYVIDKNGLHKDPQKVEAIVKAPNPKTVTEVKSFLGLVGFYARFFPNIAQVLAPIYTLLKKDQEFDWNKDCEAAFKLVKETIASEKVLVHYNPSLPVTLQSDASIQGVGAAIFHIMEDGSERPISFASRSLSKAERNYSSLDREALAIVFGVRKFSHFLLGREFTIKTDHEPLVAIFGPKNGIPAMAAGRLQRWALFLSNFTFNVRYIKGSSNVNADFLSRFPLESSSNDTESDEGATYLNFLESSSEELIDIGMVKRETEKDQIIIKVKEFVRSYWPKEEMDTAELKPFALKKHQLTIEDEVLMWGYRVVVPTTIRQKLLSDLHATHEGIVKMKSRARAYFWWPNLDRDIEDLSHNCTQCIHSAPDPARVPHSPWPVTEYPMQRIHADFLGPLRNKRFLIILDSFSKWPEVYQMNSTVATETIERFRDYFARFGLADLIVTDNGPQFTANEFVVFCDRNGIKALTTAAYKPQSNGAAENAVKSFKNGIMKATADPRNSRTSLQTIISRYLYFYRSSTHATTGETPFQLMFNRPMRTHFDRLKPKILEKVSEQVEQRIKKEQEAAEKRVKKSSGTGEPRVKTYNVGDIVMVKMFRLKGKAPNWERATMIKQLGVNMFSVKLCRNGRVVKKHSDQIQNRVVGRISEGNNKGANNVQSPKHTRSGRKW